MKTREEKDLRNEYERSVYRNCIASREDSIARSNNTHSLKLKDKFAKMEPDKIESLAWYCKYYGTSVVEVSAHLEAKRAKVYTWFKGKHRNKVVEAVAALVNREAVSDTGEGEEVQGGTSCTGCKSDPSYGEQLRGIVCKISPTPKSNKYGNCEGWSGF